MQDERSRKRAAFLGTRGRSQFFQPAPLPAPMQETQRPFPRPQPQEPRQDMGPQPRRLVTPQQMDAPPRRRRLTAREGFAPIENTPVMDDQEVEDFIAEAERREPGSHVRPNADTGTMAVGGPGYKEVDAEKVAGIRQLEKLAEQK